MRQPIRISWLRCYHPPLCLNPPSDEAGNLGPDGSNSGGTMTLSEIVEQVGVRDDIQVGFEVNMWYNIDIVRKKEIRPEAYFILAVVQVTNVNVLCVAGGAIMEDGGHVTGVLVFPFRVTAACHLNVNSFMSLNVLKVRNLIVDTARMMDGINQGANRNEGKRASGDVITGYDGIQRLVPCLGDENFLGMALPDILVGDAVDYTSRHAGAYSVALGAGLFGWHVSFVNLLRHGAESQG